MASSDSEIKEALSENETEVAWSEEAWSDSEIEELRPDIEEHRSDSERDAFRLHKGETAVEDEEEEEEYWKCVPLYKAALTGDWKEAERIIGGDGDALTAKITQHKEIALHVAVATDIALDLVKQYLQVEKSAEYSARGDIENPTRQKVKAMLWRVLELLVPPIKHIQHIREQKLKHNQALQLVKYLCEQVRSLEDLKDYKSLAGSPLLDAAKLGIHEIIEEIVNSFPRAIYATDPYARDPKDRNRNIFELAVIKRQENVFNLLYQMGEYEQSSTGLVDGKGNTLLHLVGNQAPIEKLNVVPGAALQMQRELQWFKEVEKFVIPSYIEKQNHRGETPSTVFTNNHKDLVVEGEKWMKNRATSCTIAATLITAIVFAAAITVPGGNNNTSGLPIFSTEKAFIIFVVSDAIALFMSTTSLLIFLSILTSRYAEDDFLYVLPHRLIIGLVTLFLSITTMIVAFSSTICLMLGDKDSWLLGLVVTSACLPISSFMLLQFPLLVDLMSSTYGPGIFGKQSNRSFY
ncbi:hypothetical protein HYC85_003627 [Camellia sinensis]|uniref:PGG domain-containing protein n=1 Tax=Camellia sinensis TaxID=4442 RepID=A0A7J7HU80_CAMSI|nr:hypothetical protein HYC85_003627 [Camellia sinensis]